MAFGYTGAPNLAVGVLRDVQMLPKLAQYNQVVQDAGGTEAGFIMAGSSAADQQAVVLYK